jgi:hypothetical protein
MVVKRLIFGVSLIALCASAASAQTTVGTAQERAQAQARYKVFVMEGVLERAVQNGAAVLSRQVRTFSPEAMFLTGTAQVRGFRLDGYGVFFDVEVPALRPTVAWTLRAMADDNGASLERIRSYVRKAQDPRDRAELELALRNLEVQMPSGRLAAGTATVSAQTIATGQASAPSPAPQADPSLLADPNAAYTREVKAALIDAMLENGGPLAIAADEWLTIAARDGEAGNRLVPGDAYDLSTTVLRVKGGDLAAYRAGQLTLEEARKRVEVREF